MAYITMIFFRCQALKAIVHRKNKLSPTNYVRRLNQLTSFGSTQIGVKIGT